MQLLPSLLFGISASLDALLVGMAYGMRGASIPLTQNLFISLITLAGTCLSMRLGAVFTPLLSPVGGGCIGSLILLFLGFYYICKWAFSRQPQPAGSLTAAAGPSPRLTLPEAFFLSLSLSANNLGIGFSASMTGLVLLPAAAVAGFCSVVFLLLGNRLGQSRFLRLAGRLADPLSGLLLISLGLLPLFL